MHEQSYKYIFLKRIHIHTCKCDEDEVDEDDTDGVTTLCDARRIRL